MLEYFDRKRKRILLENGRSLVTPETLCELLLRGKDIDAYCIDDEEEVERYLELYRKDLSTGEEPHYEALDHEDEAWEVLIDRIASSPRMSDDPEYVDRVEAELEFFRKSANIQFLVRVSDLIQKFKEDGVIWGVGRGSACASLVCYVLGINDIDPIRYRIPFVELSKDYS